MSQSEMKETSTFVRVLISIFCLLLAAMVIFNYVWVEPQGELNNGIVFLLFLLLVLVLAESFDNFSLGKLLTISREVRKKEKEVQTLEKKNNDLLSQLISVTSNNTQNQSHTNVYGDYHAPPTVTKASDEEVEESKSSEQPPARVESSTPTRVSYNWREAEKLSLSKYLASKKIHQSNVITEAKLTTQFHGIDPVSNIQPIYDAYYRDDDHEVFVEFRPNRSIPFMYRDRLYVMLSKISHYKTTKKVNAYLELVLMNTPEEEPSRNGGSDRLLEYFEPAIASGLLRISEIEFSEQELTSIKE
ncbi:hypothetical protein [Spongiibacter tropicus]|mgnify:CR=1 FL=1|uniref:hypothetical protein n=1 Tax=Spongiibacter tropicus TaxID=454602 RepID=UPI0003B539A5|nr:hypothetical protein [Spongiibacter tropicus]|tara:strand:+ start:193 stop:1098 length:906 start_codon:yes stop_codon:yes gene_type:complete